MMDDNGAAYSGAETTGFRSPAQDHIEHVIDLARVLDLQEPGIYPVRVSGQAFVDRGIRDGDILIANTAARPAHGKAAVACCRAASGWRRSNGAARPGSCCPRAARKPCQSVTMPKSRHRRRPRPRGRLMPVYALSDANTFYCSCERVFNPALRGVPTVVLSKQ